MEDGLSGKIEATRWIADWEVLDEKGSKEKGSDVHNFVEVCKRGIKLGGGATTSIG